MCERELLSGRDCGLVTSLIRPEEDCGGFLIVQQGTKFCEQDHGPSDHPTVENLRPTSSPWNSEKKFWAAGTPRCAWYWPGREKGQSVQRILCNLWKSVHSTWISEPEFDRRTLHH